ncbi:MULTISPECIES: BTAD domain-containing putative transcriptional regulator [unclassified Streptomyces]|uniref:BTAD domain-containing putative transcriptional regulator n=1 Tax=unclassified Streptomyces TaxID=2593676 RepID=UPI000367AA88|nr:MULTISPECIES: BTAD domain-containing putative transcriptional regulator [unclassified Streptomyces]MYT29946.1 AAA family ATPase [Streptomyces sp. SID8354]
MHFRILGPLEALADDRPIGLGGTKQRATLGFLLLQANHVVATSQLLGALWAADDAPTTARKILHNAVSGIRGALSGGYGAHVARSAALLTRPPGYVMQVDPELVDLHLFEKWAGVGREKLTQGLLEEAARLLREALALWRGPVLADLVEAGVDWPELAAVQHARLDVLEDYFEAQLGCGRHHRVLTELEAMVKAEPLRERSCGQLMLALYRCGRQADALSVYRRMRDGLVENLGLEPGRGLKRLQQAILAQDPVLSLGGAASPYAPFDVVARGNLARQVIRSARSALVCAEGSRGEDGSRAALAEVGAGQEVRRSAEGAFGCVPAAEAAAGWRGEAPVPEGRGEGAARQPSELGYELLALRGLFGITRHRSVPHLVTVVGEPGAGKSRLLREFGGQATDLPGSPLFLSGRFPAVAHGDPLTAPAQILSAYCGLRPDDAAATAWARLAETVRSLFGSAQSAGWTLARLVPLVDPTSDSRCGGTPGEVMVAWREFFQAAARRRPVVLGFDDVHHADGSVLDAVEELAQCAGPVPLFIVAAADPELLLRRRSWAGGSSQATTLTLGRSTRDTTDRLVASLSSAVRGERPTAPHGVEHQLFDA